jgi:hypothetical protein
VYASASIGNIHDLSCPARRDQSRELPRQIFNPCHLPSNAFAVGDSDRLYTHDGCHRAKQPYRHPLLEWTIASRLNRRHSYSCQGAEEYDHGVQVILPSLTLEGEVEQSIADPGQGKWRPWVSRSPRNAKRPRIAKQINLKRVCQGRVFQVDESLRRPYRGRR